MEPLTDIYTYSRQYDDPMWAKDYLKDWYSERLWTPGPNAKDDKDLDDPRTFMLREIYDCITQIPYGQSLLVDIGSGPCFLNAAIGSIKFERIILADYAQCNRLELQKWLDKEPDATNWEGIIRCTLQPLGFPTTDNFANSLRRKIVRVVHCDVLNDPIIDVPLLFKDADSQEPEPIDGIISSICLEAAVTSSNAYVNAFKRLVDLLKPGGYLILAGLYGSACYTVGGKAIYGLPLDKDLIQLAIDNSGLKVLKIAEKLYGGERGNDGCEKPYTDLQGMWVLFGQKT